VSVSAKQLYHPLIAKYNEFIHTIASSCEYVINIAVISEFYIKIAFISRAATLPHMSNFYAAVRETEWLSLRLSAHMIHLTNHWTCFDQHF